MSIALMSKRLQMAAMSSVVCPIVLVVLLCVAFVFCIAACVYLTIAVLFCSQETFEKAINRL